MWNVFQKHSCQDWSLAFDTSGGMEEPFEGRVHGKQLDHYRNEYDGDIGNAGT